MAIHLSTDQINLLSTPDIRPGTKVGGILGMGGTKIPDFVTGDPHRDMATVAAFANTDEGKALKESYKKDLASKGVDVSKFDNADFMAILQHDQQKQESIKLAGVDTSWDAIKAGATASAAAAQSPAATTSVSAPAGQDAGRRQDGGAVTVHRMNIAGA